MRKLLLTAWSGVALSGVAFAQQIVSPEYFVETVATNLSQPTTMAFVGTGEFLILEKATGKVKRFVDGVLQNTALDLAVANNGERGLLGICLDPDFAINHFIYLYYSLAANDGGTWFGNRIDRFVFNGTNLTQSATIHTFPVDVNQPNGPIHNGGVLLIGPDRKLYVITGDLQRGRMNDPRIEQNTGTQVSSGVGGIHRFNLDGSIPADNPFFSNPDPNIRTMYSYGCRNSFGLTYDPLSGKIWYTENGPNNYDEINYLPMGGFNSGWLKIIGPDSRDAEFDENGFDNYDEGDLTHIPGSYYSDPAFSWFGTIGPTAILFLTTDKVAPADKNQCLVGCVNTGELYLYKVNALRNGLVLTGDLADKVADTSSERSENTFGTHFGTATDLKIGPDGYVYVSSLSNGRVYRLRPVTENLPPIAFSLFRGGIVSGDLDSLKTSDNDRLVLAPGAVFQSSDPPIQLILDGKSPFTSPSSLQFKIESNASAAGIVQTISLLNEGTGEYENVSTKTVTLVDSLEVVTIDSNAGRFVAPDGAIRAKVSYKASGPVFRFPWFANVDLAGWSATR
jgi:glucose/arabinose dehydrogenase